jgi:pimeloyl-ACP methyl ester carboxylesterase
MMKNPKEVIHADFYACDHFNFMGQLDRITVPTLILCGTDDALTPPKYSEYLSAEIRGSELVLIPDAGHLLMLEKPLETNRAIESFVNRR